MNKFKNLGIGENFDFISDDITINSFYRPCQKVATNKYMDEFRHIYTIGTINANIYNIGKHDKIFK